MSILIPMASAHAASAELRDALRDMPGLTELDERRAVAAVRDPLRAAVAHTYSAALILDDAHRRCVREFVR